MVYRNYLFPIIIIVFTFCSSCSNEPSKEGQKKELIRALNEELSSRAKVSSIDINFEYLIGNSDGAGTTSYDPRYVGKVILLEPTYEIVDYLAGNVNSNVIKEALPKGAEINIHGTAITVFSKDGWSTRKTRLYYDDKIGEFINDFDKPVIIEGSSAHQEALNKFKEWKKQQDEFIEKCIKAIIGKWTGSYWCQNQEWTGCTLVISKISPTTIGNLSHDAHGIYSISGTFSFYPTNQNPKPKRGSWSFSGLLYPNGTITLNPVQWIQRPRNIAMVSITGLISEDFHTIEGKILHGQCKTIKLNKVK